MTTSLPIWIAALGLVGCGTPATLNSPPDPSAAVSVRVSPIDPAVLEQEADERLAVIATALAPMCASCRPLFSKAKPHLDAFAALRVLGDGDAAEVWFATERFAPLLQPGGAMPLYALAHEYGHYIDIREGGLRKDAWAMEVLADAIAGCALARLGVPSEPVVEGYSTVTPIGSREAVLDLACGSDAEHPAYEWLVRALVVGVDRCATEVPSYRRLRATIEPLVAAAHRDAARARALLADPDESCAAHHAERPPAVNDEPESLRGPF